MFLDPALEPDEPEDGLIQVTLRHPDGTEHPAEASIQHGFGSAAARKTRCCVVRGMVRDDIPVGTEVWLNSPS